MSKVTLGLTYPFNLPEDRWREHVEAKLKVMDEAFANKLGWCHEEIMTLRVELDRLAKALAER